MKDLTSISVRRITLEEAIEHLNYYGQESYDHMCGEILLDHIHKLERDRTELIQELSGCLELYELALDGLDNLSTTHSRCDRRGIERGRALLTKMKETT